MSRPLQWYFRSAEFFQAILHSDWAGTLFSEHPGVTVMWLSGAALWGWYGLQSLLGLNPPTPLETEGYAFADRIAIGILPLAFVVALGIVFAWHLLRRLFGERVAWVAAVLCALDPFYLANSKALHLDATLSTLMLLSALCMLLYLQDGKRRDLAVSAVLGGLAILTKVTALFLIPFLGLCLLVHWLSSLRGPESVLRHARSGLRDLAVWLVVALAVCFALWPSFWVQPAAAFDTVIQKGILNKVTGSHGLPRFYGDALATGDPGTAYYLDTLLFRTTALTLPFCLVGLGVLSSQRRDRRAVLLSGFALLYFAQMALAGRKESRYMLPVILVVDVMAARGIVWWAERVAGRRALATALTGALLLAQAFVVISRHPYYGTHYNALMGGGQAARRVFPLGDFGEGLDLAGQYVDRQASGNRTVVGTQFLANEMLAQHVSVPVRDISETGDDVDYLVFGVQYIMRGDTFPRWGALWERVYKFRDPAYLVLFDDIPYAWVHRPQAEPTIPERMDVRLGESIRLMGYRLANHTASPGDTLLLTLYWQAVDRVEDDYNVLVYLRGPEGEVVGQKSDSPTGDRQPTSEWTPDTLIEDTYEIPVSRDARWDTYALSVGMCDVEASVGLTARDGAGDRFPDDRIPLTTVQVQAVVPRWRWALTGCWLTVIALGVFGPRRRGVSPS